MPKATPDAPDRVDRRHFLRAGGSGLLGLGAASLPARSGASGVAFGGSAVFVFFLVVNVALIAYCIRLVMRRAQ